jgi:hypothetical protein
VVSAIAIRLYRVALYAYPRQFRQTFGDEMVRIVTDRRRHEGRSEWCGLLEEAVDAARAAPRMRWESPMNRVVILAAFGTTAVAAALVAQLALIPIAVLGLAVWFAWGRPLQPIAPAAASRRWAMWVVAGSAGIAIAIAIPAIDGGELNAFWWTVMMLTLLSGIGLAITGASLAVAGRPHRAASSRSS